MAALAAGSGGRDGAPITTTMVRVLIPEGGGFVTVTWDSEKDVAGLSQQVLLQDRLLPWV